MALSRDGIVRMVRQDLLRRLGTQWVEGQWLPPVAELAKILQAGHGSTHRALRELAREGYLLPLRGKGTRVLKGVPESERPSAAPAASQSQSVCLPGTAQLKHRPLVAIVRSQHTDPMIHRMIDAFMESAKPMDPLLSFVVTTGQEEPWRLPHAVDAVVAFNQPGGTFGDDLRTFARHIVSVTTAAPSDQLRRHDADVVTIDQHSCGRLAAQCLRDAGWDLACFIGRRDESGEYDATSLARLRGFEAGWGERLADECLMYGRFYGPKTGRHGFLRWTRLTPRPQGIFAASDELAMGVLSAAVLEGLRPGVDFQLVGVDGQERARNATGFPLTSIQMPADAMGRQAARLLRQRLLEGETHAMQVVLQCSLFKGMTVRPAGAKASTPSAEIESDTVDIQADAK